MAGNIFSSLQSSGEAANSDNQKAAGSAKQSCDGNFIEIQLLNEDNKGIAGVKCLFTLPDGTELSGISSPDGIVRKDGIKPGYYKITFPNLDEDLWEKYQPNTL